MTIADTAPHSVRTVAPPVWRTYGGGGLVLGGAVLFAATIAEWVYYAGGAGDALLGLAQQLAFVAALAVLAASTIPLALGATGRDGVVGASTLGRVALIAYGWLFLVAQTVQLAAQLALTGTEADAAMTVSLALTGAQGIAAIVAAIMIVRARMAAGVARWSLVISVAAGIAAGAIAITADSLDAVMIGFCVSAASIVFVGASYLAGAPTRIAERAAVTD